MSGVTEMPPQFSPAGITGNSRFPKYEAARKRRTKERLTSSPWSCSNWQTAISAWSNPSFVSGVAFPNQHDSVGVGDAGSQPPTGWTVSLEKMGGRLIELTVPLVWKFLLRVWRQRVCQKNWHCAGLCGSIGPNIGPRTANIENAVRYRQICKYGFRTKPGKFCPKRPSRFFDPTTS